MAKAAQKATPAPAPAPAPVETPVTVPAEYSREDYAEYLGKLMEVADHPTAPYLMAHPNHTAVFVNDGHVVVNAAISDGEGKIAHKITQAGIDFWQTETAAMKAEVAPVAPTGNVKGTFEIETGVTVPPDGRKRAGRKPDVYPFAALEIGQSFFVPATDKRPEPWKTLASTVNTASARYAEPKADGSTRVNRKGKTVPVTVQTRLFRLFKGEKTMADGSVVKGARVFRVQPEA